MDDDNSEHHASGSEDSGSETESIEVLEVENTALLLAAADGQDNDVQKLLDEDSEGVNTHNSEGQTPLHLAVQNKHLSTTRLLVQKGPDIEATDNQGKKPLYVAAEVGFYDGAKFLLESQALVESNNSNTGLTALHKAVNGDYLSIAKLLSQHGADVNAKDPEGRTPLCTAVTRRNREIVQLLLQEGADKYIVDGHNNTVLGLAEGSDEMIDLLRVTRLLQGPAMPGTGTAPTDQTPAPQRPFTAPINRDQVTACHSFQATVIDFFIGDTEQRIQKSCSIYELLYGEGPNTIMAAGREQSLKDKKPTFRWFHLPANNMEWVQDLLRRHFSGNEEAPVPLSDEYQAKMRLLRTSSGASLFMRPGCHTVKIHPDGSPGDGGVEQIVSVVPFLHYETLQGIQAMANASTIRHPGYRPAGLRPAGGKSILGWMAGSSKHFKKKKKGKTAAGGGYFPAPPPPGPMGGFPPRFPPPPVTGPLPPPPPPGSGLRPRQPYPHQPPHAGVHRLQQNDPHWHLISGYYLGPGVYGHAPPLQLRRTLDKYFYTHLQTDDPRNTDQVVARATSEAPSPVLFVVDQLWVWIVNGDTIITCLPTVWNHRSVTHLPPPPPPPRPRPSFAKPLEAGNHGQERAPMSALADPLDVHQNILRYLRTTRRAPITTAHELADLVTNFCANVFDPYQVPEHLQFFDLFERSIGIVADKAAKRFKEFRHAASSVSTAQRMAQSHLSIKLETDLLIEIEDIRDELSILQMVLEDQRETTQTLNRFLGRHGVKTEMTDPYLADYGNLESNRVLEGHLSEIKKMIAIAKKTSKMLYYLLDLKQKQASIIEALAASAQADRAADHAKQQADQAAETRIQSEESVKQGKTVLLFTVVTVIFLPLSFMAAFFTINIEGFPVNDKNNLELGYVLKYMLSISAGLSIPFIIVIFNQDRVWMWLGSLRDMILRLPTSIWISLIAMGVALAVIWTASLVRAIRIALTICVVLIGLMAIVIVAMRDWFASQNEERRTVLEKLYTMTAKFFGSKRRRPESPSTARGSDYS